MVGGDRSFKLALKEEDDEFSDELREDCEVRGEGGRRGEERMRGVDGRGGEGREGGGPQSVRWFQPITLIPCVEVEVPCKPS